MPGTQIACSHHEGSVQEPTGKGCRYEKVLKILTFKYLIDTRNRASPPAHGRSSLGCHRTLHFTKRCRSLTACATFQAFLACLWSRVEREHGEHHRKQQ